MTLIPQHAIVVSLVLLAITLAGYLPHMNQAHIQARIKNREKRLLSKLNELRSARERYLARGDKQLEITYIEPQLQEITVKYSQHQQALAR